MRRAVRGCVHGYRLQRMTPELYTTVNLCQQHPFLGPRRGRLRVSRQSGPMTPDGPQTAASGGVVRPIPANVVQWPYEQQEATGRPPSTRPVAGRDYGTCCRVSCRASVNSKMLSRISLSNCSCFSCVFLPRALGGTVANGCGRWGRPPGAPGDFPVSCPDPAPSIASSTKLTAWACYRTCTHKGVGHDI